jgi:hypothetical protein
MSVVKEITVLALTKMHGGVCTAGVDEAGRWVRPVRPTAVERHSPYEPLTDYCLLPLDFFHSGQSHLVPLGVTRCWLKSDAPQPPHIEDWLLDLNRKPQLIRKLDPGEQAAFLAAHAEADLTPLDPEHRRSLGLFRAGDFSFVFGQNKTGDDVQVRASFTVGEREVPDVGCTDLRLRALGRKLLAKSGGKPCALTHEDFRRHGKEATYLAVGLSRLHQGKHWLLLVGVHTLPELAVEVDYGKL